MRPDTYEALRKARHYLCQAKKWKELYEECSVPCAPTIITLNTEEILSVEACSAQINLGLVDLSSTPLEFTIDGNDIVVNCGSSEPVDIYFNDNPFAQVDCGEDFFFYIVDQDDNPVVPISIDGNTIQVDTQDCGTVQINVNGTAFYEADCGETVPISIVDIDENPATIINITGTQITVQTPCNKLPTKSGQTLSYATGDDGDDQRAREISFFHLTNNNPFGNNRRFTGTTGGYHVNSDNTFRDKDGNVTTKALAFPNDIMLDWAYVNGDNLSGQVMMWYHENTGNLPSEDREWLNMISNITALSVGGYTGWKMPNLTEYSIILFKNDIDNLFLNYEPFAANGSRIYWSNETVNVDVTRAYRLQTGALIYIGNQSKTNQATSTRLMAVRYGNYSVSGTTVTIS
jgi:hypothetical protein